MSRKFMPPVADNDRTTSEIDQIDNNTVYSKGARN